MNVLQLWRIVFPKENAADSSFIFNLMLKISKYSFNCGNITVETAASESTQNP